MIAAAKQEMLSGFGSPCADLPLAASFELNENSRLGFAKKNAALHLGQEVCSSTTALEIERGLLGKCIGSRVQSWNRYAYVGNNPLGATDPLGLFGEPSCWYYYCVPSPCGPEDPTCNACDPNDPYCGGVAGGGSGGGGGGGGGVPAPQTPDQLPRNGGVWLNNETLGLPSGMNLRPMSLAELLGLSPGTECDFGVCAPLGDNFLPALAGGGTLICQIAEPCGIIEDGILITAAAVVGIAAIHQLAKGRTNVGHDYVRDEARNLAKELGISYCEALQRIYDAARTAGNSKKANDTKATQKQDGCRGH